MCGMFYVEDDLDDEIARAIRGMGLTLETFMQEAAGMEAQSECNTNHKNEKMVGGLRDVRPTEEARILVPVWRAEIEPARHGTSESAGRDSMKTATHGVQIKKIRWGFPGFQKGQLIINARSETAMEKPTFRESMERHRILIPATGFYEWNRSHEKNVFRRTDGRAMFFAGLFGYADTQERFTILTTAANDSMRTVHDRMPLILEESEITSWLFDTAQAIKLLTKRPVELQRDSEYEQLSLFT